MILVTGAAGFIGANLVKKLLSEHDAKRIVGIDNMNDYYDVSLKEYRLHELEMIAQTAKSEWSFLRGDIADKKIIDEFFHTYRPDIVVNLAAQAGVR